MPHAILAPTISNPTPLPFPAPPPAPPRSTGLYGIRADLLTLGGLSILSLPLFWLIESYRPLALPDGRIAAPLVLLLTWAAYAVNYPHYAATYARAYGRRSAIHDYWRSTILTPIALVVLAMCAMVFPSPGIAWYFKAYLIVSGYHYSGQTYGIALIFARKAGLHLSRGEKYLLMAPIYASWAYLVCRMESLDATPMVFLETMALTPIGLPAWGPTLGLTLFLSGLFAYALLNLKLYSRCGQMLPGVSHIAVAAQSVWFVVGANTPAFVNFVPFFHCLQYLMITTYFHFHSNQPKPDAAALDTHAPSTARRFIGYYAALVVIGYLMYELTPVVLSGAGLTGFAEASALTVAFINLHHFILDGEIWKLRKPDVKQALVA